MDDLPDFPSGNPSPRRELQGPRPTPLKVRKDSYKIKKPPIAPQQSRPPPQQPPPPPPPQRHQPVIIYTVSPKVIHTNASNFMTLVQRLTGSSSSSSSSSSSLSSSYVDTSGGAISPAARLAVIEKTSPPKLEKSRPNMGDIGNFSIEDGFDMDTLIERSGSFPGILSPVPSSFPPISPSFFSPSLPDPNSITFLHDLSPIFYGNNNFIEGNFMPSPSAFLSTPIASPTLSFDLFNQLFDF